MQAKVHIKCDHELGISYHFGYLSAYITLVLIKIAE